MFNKTKRSAYKLLNFIQDFMEHWFTGPLKQINKIMMSN